ncbi:MAG: anthranilate synthase component I [Candidatus Marinimicrobia bacterium]|nr:anthranilate synthase component I [Candidatus Neomarinimicrobiota bacterium]
MMTFEEFKYLAKSHKVVPVYQRVLADLLTPVSAYMRVAKDTSYNFLMESVEKGNRFGRYSFIGINPKLILSHSNGKTTVLKGDPNTSINQPFHEILRNILNQYKVPHLPGLPSFSGGLVGYLSYETARWTENIPIHFNGGLGTPDAIFMLYDEVLAFDHFKNQVIVFTHVEIKRDTDLKELYRLAQTRIDKLGKALHTDIDYQSPKTTHRSKQTCDISREEFEQSVLKAKDYIKSGDIFQVVLSQRFRRSTQVDPFTIYRALRTINPSMYMFYLKLNDFDIVGASPELLVKVENGNVEIRPIAGTRPRGKTELEDNQLAEELLCDEKEKAEHLMLLDLARNDVGRVVEKGSVQVKDYMIIERYSHVMHIVSDVQGKLEKNKDIFDALFSGFPAGTTTGAPKIRAMEIIHELETHRRDIYSGAVGYIDLTGNLNTCIAIRVLVMKDGEVYFQSGAGIVHDSQPDREYQETINKAKAIMQAIDLAEDGLVST